MMADVTLFQDGFAAMPIGVIAGDYSPAGEYHVPPVADDPGPWRETVVHHSFRTLSRGNWQIVLEADGAKVLEQTAQLPSHQAMLAAGDEGWQEVVVEASLRPLTLAGWRGVVFRYRHARRFYAAVFCDGMLRLIRRINDRDVVLGETPCVLDPDRYLACRISVEGMAFRVAIDGREVLRAADATAEGFASGGIALAADHLTRFRDVRVTATAHAAAAAGRAAEQRRQRLVGLQERYPKPRLWKRFATPRFGTDRNLRVGDLDGDGKPEIVLARRTDRLGGDNFSMITSLAAYDLDGRVLWTFGEPDAGHTHTTCDLCYQLHDLDGDGRTEVVFAFNHELCIADGATGAIRRRIPLPHRLDRDPAKPYRMVADAIYFCDLLGTGRPNSILVKDRYKHLYAYGPDLRPLWSFAGNLGHYPFARDVNGDGKDEVAIGYHLLDHDGKALWTGQFLEHADNVALLDLRDAPGALPQMRLVMAASDAGFLITDVAGHVRGHYPIGHGQSLCAARLLPDRPGIQLMVNTFWGAAGITAVFDEAGEFLHDFEPMPYACLLQLVNWVPCGDGEPRDLVLLSTHPRQGGLIDGHGHRCAMFPDDGHPALCSDARDLDGDGIDEVLTWNEHELWIYKADVPGRTPANYPVRQPWYNDSNYRAQLSLPR